MNTKLHLTSSDAECMRVASYIYMSTVIREKCKIPYKKFAVVKKKEKKWN